MAKKRFKLKPRNNPNVGAGIQHFFWCLLFDTKVEMYAWYASYIKKRGDDKNKDWDYFGFEGFSEEMDFSAMVLPYEIVLIDESGLEAQSNEIGTVIFCKEQTGPGVVSHEMGHCAMWYERLVFGNKNAEFGESIGINEERLFYLMTDFVTQFYTKISGI